MIVQGLWVGNKISLIEYLSYTSFIKNGFEYHLYTYSHLKDLPCNIVQKDANEILNEKFIVKSSKDGNLANFSDLFRWHLILKKGGVYVDSDVICIRPFETKTNTLSGELQKHTNKQVASTQYLNFEKNHPLMEKLVDESSKKDLATINFPEIGPPLLQKFILDEKNILNYHNFNPNPWWEWKKTISKENTEELLELISSEEVYAIHLWNEMWRRGKADKNKFEDGTLISHLINRYEIK